MAEWDKFTNQQQWEQYLKQLVKSNNKALYRAVVIVYQNQTDKEQISGQSIEDNYVGFTKWDAKEMTAIAQKIIRKQKLTDSEIAKSRNKMQKYWKQLMVASKKKIEQRELERSRKELQLKQEAFQKHNEMLRRCAEDGIPCGYGICHECVLTTGIQTRMDVD